MDRTVVVAVVVAEKKKAVQCPNALFLVELHEALPGPACRAGYFSQRQRPMFSLRRGLSWHHERRIVRDTVHRGANLLRLGKA